MPDFPEIGYGTVTGRFLAGVLDSDDAAAAPDAEPLQGAVVFTATANVLLVTSAAPPATLFPVPVRVKLDVDGNIAHQGSLGVSLWATDDPDGNPVNWQWHVHFELTHRGKSVYRAPFNFELPTGATVDLTVVAPLVVLDDGTIIIQGPPGESAGDIITAQGDLISGDIAGDAAILPVGAAGSYLAPEPAAPLGLEWKPLPIPESGLKKYADMAALYDVREAEVGIWHSADLRADLGPDLGNPSWLTPGPADVIVESTLSSADASTTQVNQVLYISKGNYSPTVAVTRYFYFVIATGVRNDPGWWVVNEFLPPAYPIYIPGLAAEASQMLSTNHDGTAWEMIYASPEVEQGYLAVIRRDYDGRAEIANPVDPLDIANKGYVDAAIGAIPPASGGDPEITIFATEAELDANFATGRGEAHIDSLANWPKLWGKFATYPVTVMVETLVGNGPNTFTQRVNDWETVYTRTSDGYSQLPSSWSTWYRQFDVPAPWEPNTHLVFNRYSEVVWEAQPFLDVPDAATFDAITNAAVGQVTIADVGAYTGLAQFNGWGAWKTPFEIQYGNASDWSNYSLHGEIRFPDIAGVEHVIFRTQVTVAGSAQPWSAWAVEESGGGSGGVPRILTEAELNATTTAGYYVAKVVGDEGGDWPELGYGLFGTGDILIEVAQQGANDEYAGWVQRVYNGSYNVFERSADQYDGPGIISWTAWRARRLWFVPDGALENQVLGNEYGSPKWQTPESLTFNYLSDLDGLQDSADRVGKVKNLNITADTGVAGFTGVYGTDVQFEHRAAIQYSPSYTSTLYQGLKVLTVAGVPKTIYRTKSGYDAWGPWAVQ